MSAVSFTYRGRDLVKPLEELIASIGAELADVEEAIEKLTPSQKLPPKISDIATPDSEHRKLERKLKALLFELLDAKLMLAEAKRTRWRAWSFDMAQTRWLYRMVADKRIVDMLKAGQ